MKIKKYIVTLLLFLTPIFVKSSDIISNQTANSLNTKSTPSFLEKSLFDILSEKFSDPNQLSFIIEIEQHELQRHSSKVVTREDAIKHFARSLSGHLSMDQIKKLPRNENSQFILDLAICTKTKSQNKKDNDDE